MTNFPKIPNDVMLKKLQPPTGKVSMVLDTDTYNEIDDQFAVVYSILSENIDLEAIYAAPFHNSRSSGPGDGMEKSYEEILRLLERLDYKHDDFVFRGSTSYLPRKSQPVESDAAKDLIKKAMIDRDQLLYVAAVGAITNVASAILMEPEIINRIVVIWLGGQPLHWPTAREFNLGQDIPASKIMFDCGVPFIHIPCKNVSEHLRTTVPEVEKYVKGRGKIGDYLHDIFVSYHKEHFAWSKVIWDISAVAWLINAQWIPSNIHPSPILTSEITWSFDPNRHFIRIANDARRDAVFGDLFRKLEKYAEGQ